MGILSALALWRGNPPTADHQPDPVEIVKWDSYIRALAENGLNRLESAALATTGNVTLSGEQNIDGTATSASRVLVKDQTDPTENGVYVTASGAWSRATDADADDEIAYAYVHVIGGSANAGKSWQVTTAPEIGVGEVVFAQVDITADLAALEAALGTASGADVGDFATAAQGATADSAVQPGDLADVATSGVYGDLSGTPSLGSAAAADTGDFATAAQGVKADSAVQPGALGTAAAQNVEAFATAAQGDKADTAVQPGALSGVATSGDYSDLTGKPSLGTAAAANTEDFATAAQGGRADTAVQPGALARAQLLDAARAEAREAWSTDLTGDPESRGAIAEGALTEVDGSGDVLVIDGDEYEGSIDVAPRRVWRIEDGRLYRLRVALQRIVDPSDPSGHAVELRVQNMTKAKAAVSNVALFTWASGGDAPAITVADGRVTHAVTIGRDGSGADYEVPMTSVYLTPLLRMYGDDHQAAVELVDLVDVTDIETKAAVDGLGSAALADTGDFATAAQGAKADSAVQPGALGTAAAQNVEAFATAAQGDKADTAVQPAGLEAVETGLQGQIDTLDTTKADDADLSEAYGVGAAVNRREDIGAVAQLWSLGTSLAIVAGWFRYNGGRVGVGWDRLGRVVTTGIETRLTRSLHTLKKYQAIHQASGVPVLTHDRKGRIRAPFGFYFEARKTLYSLADHFPLLKNAKGTIIGLRRDGIDAIVSQRMVDRIHEKLGGTALLGDDRETVGSVEQDESARYVSVRIPGGPTVRIKQLKDGNRVTAIPARVALAMIHAQFLGQSNCGYISGPNIPEPLTGYMARDVALTIANGTINCVEGSIELDGSEAPDFVSSVEPISPSNGQNPAHLWQFAMVRLLEQMGQSPRGVVATSAFKGGTGWDEYYREETTNTIHTNALGQSVAIRRLAEEHGVDVSQGLHVIGGEEGPHGAGQLVAAYESLRDDEWPEIGGGTLPPVFVTQINMSNTTEDERGSALDMVAAYRAYPNEFILVGPNYDAPLIGPPGEPGNSIHNDNYGRMMWTERDAVATIYQQIFGITWNPFIPTDGGTERAGAVINIPMLVPPGCTFDQIRLTNDFIPSVTDSGFVVKYEGVTQTINSLALDHTNQSLVITLASNPGAASAGVVRYALDNLTPNNYFAGGRGPIHVASSLRSPFAAAGFPVPTFIRHPMIRTEETFA